MARDEVPTELTWDLTLLYPSDDAMRADLDDTLLLADKLSGFAGQSDWYRSRKSCTG